MKAAIVQGAGQAPVYGDFAEPVVAQGEVLVHVTATAISHLAKARASGTHYSSQGAFPFVTGVDGVGRLEDGRRVYFFLPRSPHGSMAERTVVASAQCVPLPDDLDDVTAAAMANPGMSSWAALTERAHLKPGETVLVNGATGVSGRLAVQIARHLGAGRVIATGRNVEVLRSLGADATVRLVEDEAALEASFREQFAQGVQVVIDYLWGKSARTLLIAGAKAETAARFVQIGSLSGAEISLPAAVLRASGLTLSGSGLGSIPTDRLVASISEMLRAAGPGGFEVTVAPVPLSQVEQVWGRDDSSKRMVFTIG